MHPTILAQRKANAVNRIVWASGALAKELELDPALVDALQPKGIKDPRVLEMMRLEGVANLMLQLAIRVGAVNEGDAVTAVTPESEPEVETPAEVESAAATIEETEPETIVAEEPAPEVLEEPALIEAKPKPRRKSSSKK